MFHVTIDTGPVFCLVDGTGVEPAGGKVTITESSPTEVQGMFDFPCISLSSGGPCQMQDGGTGPDTIGTFDAVTSCHCGA